MDKLVPQFQATPVTTRIPESASTWYVTETNSGIFTSSEIAWMHAQGWQTFLIVISGADTTYFLQRRLIHPELVLGDLVASYTEAYNEGRQLNDQRYDDLLVMYIAILDKTEDEFNDLETDDAAYQALAEVIFTALDTDFTAYDADVTGDLDTFGADLLAEVNARFDAERAKTTQALVDRGLSSSVMNTTMLAGVERERTRALNNANDTITQRQLELKHRVYAEQKVVRQAVVAARERLRGFLRTSVDRHVAVRNQAAAAIGRLVEARTDSYPDLSEIGRLAAALGQGSAEAFAP